MRKELPRAATAAILGLIVVIAVAVGWYMINRDTQPLAMPELAKGERHIGARSRPGKPQTPAGSEAHAEGSK